MLSATAYGRFLNHFGEEVCGDNYQSGKTIDSKIFILSDGLGSGIKASILSILTTEIIYTMFEKEINIGDIVNTITKTLPVCKIRGIAYSTFTIVQIFDNGKIKIVNYDNPDVIIIKKGQIFFPQYEEQRINNKIIKKAEFYLDNTDFIFILSDGMVHAGLGNLMDFGWGIENIANYIYRIFKKSEDLKFIIDNIIEVTDAYYNFKPGDDASIIGIKCIENSKVNIFTGPPLDSKLDMYYVNKFMNKKGKKIICGGTTGNIVGKLINEEIKIDLKNISGDEIPPYGTMKSVDLVTEGVLTIKEINNILSDCEKDIYEIDFDKKDNSAYQVIRMLRDCDEISILVGRKVNVFYHNPSLPFDMSIRANLIRELTNNLERLGKSVSIEYC